VDHLHKDQRLSLHEVNGPYRGYKTDIWDGGSRVALVAEWPGRIEPGITTEVEFCLADLFASLTSLTGAELKQGGRPPEAARAEGRTDARPPETRRGLSSGTRFQPAPDSWDLMEAFFGRRPAAPRNNLITHSYTGVYSIRIENWKLILDTEGSGGDRAVTYDWAEVVPGSAGQLYNLAEDPYETVNLWKDKQDLVRQLSYQIQEYRRLGGSAPG